jgi:uncharacterized RDD family membrane protein YckC
MRWVDEHRIETPEQIDINLEMAGLGSRFFAQVVDWLIQIACLLALFLLGLVLFALLGLEPDIRSDQIAVIIVIALAVYMLMLGYDIYFEARHNGQTPGKKYARIRVMRQDGGPIDFRAAAVRNLLGFADFLPMFYLLGAFLILATKRGQRLGDLAAGTIVTRERGAGDVPDEPVKAIDRFASDEYHFASDQLRACTPEDRNVLRAFLRRYARMDGKARGRLAEKLADQYLARIGAPEGVIDVIAETYLASLYRDLLKNSSYTS